MKTSHYYLCTAAAAAPERWREAFPTGRAMDAGAYLRHPPADGSDSIVWLNADDGHWQHHLRRLRTARPGERVVVLSSQPDDRQALQALEAGASGYAHTYAVPGLLHEVSLVVEHGGLWVGPALLHRLLGSARDALAPDAVQAAAKAGALSVREQDVAHAVAAGHSNKEVALMLGITERTVKAHLSAAFEKLGVRDRLQLALHLTTPPAAAEVPERRVASARG